jgi:integrating conjugative element protein (TIGR03757 family)
VFHKMIKRLVLWVLAISPPCFAEALLPYVQKIEVFADGAVTVPRYDGVVVIAYDLNEITEMNKAITFKGKSLEESHLMMKQWFESPAYQHFQQQQKIVLEPMNLMAKYGVAKIPAIVFNEGHFAVYGTTDVQKAIRDIEQLMADEAAAEEETDQ